MSERKKLGEHIVTFRHVVMALPIVAAGLLVFGSFVVGQSAARAEGVARELTEHKADEQRKLDDTTSAVREAQNDVRALYRYMATGVRQPQLEHPVPTEPVAQDGGP